MIEELIAQYIGTQGFSAVFGVLMAFVLFRKRRRLINLSPEEFHNEANEILCTEITQKIANTLEELIPQTSVNIRPTCSSSASLAEKLVFHYASDLNALRQVYDDLVCKGISSEHFQAALDILNNLAGGLNG